MGLLALNHDNSHLALSSRISSPTLVTLVAFDHFVFWVIFILVSGILSNGKRCGPLYHKVLHVLFLALASQEARPVGLSVDSMNLHWAGKDLS